MNNCSHSRVTLLNPYELIRKYRCNSCGEVMMCACEEDFARKFLPHQLSVGTELKTQQRVRVTLGFQRNICNTCRGIAEEACPRAQTYGATTKIARYYWREIFFETTRRFDEWSTNHGYIDYRVAQRENAETYSAVKDEVINEIKELHARSPKYSYQEESQSQVWERYKIEVLKLEGVHTRNCDGKLGILEAGEIYSPEEFAARYFKQQGYDSLFIESVPFHVIFGVLMWLLIQSPSDPLLKVEGFGDRKAFEERTKGKLIWTHLPEDFGSSGYADRRATAIEEHFTMLPTEKSELLQVFDYWIDPSEEFRQYLWAHRSEDLNSARRLVSLLPVDVTHGILKYLVKDYWRRYVGWPDLMAYNQSDFFFAEVKSSRDRLSEDQKNWIRGNSTELHLPFKIVKICKKRGDRFSELKPPHGPL